MHNPDTWWAVAGAAVLIITLIDVFLTLIRLSGGGPLTNWWTRTIWRSLLAIHRRWRVHRLLEMGGPLILISIVMVWYVMLLLGWLLLFLARSDTVINSDTGAPAGFLEMVYFVGTTVSDLGYGDLVPSRFPWTVISTVAVVTATFLLTLSLSYILPVVSAAVEKRQLARMITNLGADPQEIVRRTWGRRGSEVIHQHVLSLIPAIELYSQKHEAYPVLRFFHSASRDESASIALLRLTDALFILANGTAGKDRLSPGLAGLLWNTIEGYAQLAEEDPVKLKRMGDFTSTDHLDQQILRDTGLETADPRQFKAALERYRPLRCRLAWLCVEDGWGESG